MARRTETRGGAAGKRRRPGAAQPPRGGLLRWFSAAGAPTVIPGVRGLRVLVVGLGLLTLLVVILLIVRGPDGDESRPGHGLIAEQDPESAGFGPGARAFSLHFVDAGGNLVPELREIAAKPSRTRQIEAVFEELLAGSVHGLQPAVPSGTMLRNLFTDETGTVYIDLTRDLVRGQSGNFSTEYASLAAIVQTVLINFPEFAAVQILVDGEPASTLAGHFTIARPLNAADWVMQ